MATNQTLIPPPPQQDEELHLLPQTTMDESLWVSLRDNIRAAFFPEKLPPLELTSRPVKVREIWDRDAYKKESAGVSLVVHVAMIAGLIAISIMGAKVVKEAPKQIVTLIAPDLTPQLPMTKKSDTDLGRPGRWRRSRQATSSKRQTTQGRNGADHSSGYGDSQR